MFPLFSPIDDESVLTLMRSLAEGSKLYLSMTQAGDEDFQIVDESDPISITMARRIKETLSLMEKGIRAAKKHRRQSGNPVMSYSTSAGTHQANAESLYITRMTKLRFKTIDLCTRSYSSYAFHLHLHLHLHLTIFYFSSFLFPLHWWCFL
jgi:hypothetical protein